MAQITGYTITDEGGADVTVGLSESGDIEIVQDSDRVYVSMESAKIMIEAMQMITCQPRENPND